MCSLIFFVFLALCSQIIRAMPPSIGIEENMVNLLSEKIRQMERSMDIEMRMLKNELRREIHGSCSKCLRSLGKTNISSLQLEVRTLHLDVKQLAESVEHLSSLVTHYLENTTSPLMQKIASLVNASIDSSEQMKRIQENLTLVSMTLYDALRPTETPVSATTAMVPPNVRLVNGSSPMSGRVEVYHDGEWGTICDDGWDDADASVVCRMLGYRYGRRVRDGLFGPGRGRIWLDDVNCDNDSSHLAECRHSGWGKENCEHTEDAGVECLDFIPSTTQLSNIEQVQVRLVNGKTESDGRLEVYYTRREDLGWGTVCDDDWDDREAAVVCRMLGFSGGRTAPKLVYGMGVGSILLDDLQCQGTESSLAECGHFKPGDNNCGHEEDVGVICETLLTSTDRTTQPISAIQIRLAGGPSPSEGRVEVFKDGKWGTVCDNGWDIKDAKVICRMLNYLGGSIFSKSMYGYENGNILLDNVECSGLEKSITECRFTGWRQNNSDPCNDAGVICSQVEGIRLINGSVPNEGRVEIQLNGMYGTICDDKFDDKAATVVCRMLGYNMGGVANVQAKFGEGSGPVHLDNVECLGDELSLVDCQYLLPSVTDCEHEEDVGVTCFTEENVTQTNSANNVSTKSQKLTESNMSSFYQSICKETLKNQIESLSESDRYWMKIWCQENQQNLENSTAVKTTTALINANPDGEVSHLKTANHVAQTVGDNGINKESYVSINTTPSHSPATQYDTKDVIGQPESDLSA
ncbi:hypothetical protein ACJMK2_015946 [Sinanodonta woodiana]|uniref:SRCR domain-containing protein n=1 Tax=Sinanodonta woodiana TaxID=1069815 RepID=A0ABD3UT03_SINWO